MKKQQGFTLVELAIVMVIIGLLIGGILKGQELVRNSKATATATQLKALDTAFAMFLEKYRFLPGDIANPGGVLPNCNGACATLGDLSWTIGVPHRTEFGVFLPTDERVTAFSHLAAASLISSVSINGALNFGDGLPEAAVGGGFLVGFDPNGWIAGTRNQIRPGHYLVLNGTPAGSTAGYARGITSTSDTGGIIAAQAARIDRKLDDGRAYSGDLMSAGLNCRQSNAVRADYDERNRGNCHLFYRIGVQ